MWTNTYNKLTPQSQMFLAFCPQPWYFVSPHPSLMALQTSWQSVSSPSHWMPSSCSLSGSAHAGQPCSGVPASAPPGSLRWPHCNPGVLHEPMCGWHIMTPQRASVVNILRRTFLHLRLRVMFLNSLFYWPVTLHTGLIPRIHPAV